VAGKSTVRRLREPRARRVYAAKDFVVPSYLEKIVQGVVKGNLVTDDEVIISSNENEVRKHSLFVARTLTSGRQRVYSVRIMNTGR
jgi:hypothetical protein